ncbi:hypothetical protein ACE6H2_002183 [Prunus campanulata]
MLWGSNEVKIFMKLVPMGVYYNISKFQPNWTFVECSAPSNTQPCSARFVAASILPCDSF